MADLVNIVINGRDNTGPAFKNVQAGAKALAVTIGQTGHIIGQFSGSQLGGMISQMQSAVGSMAEMSQTLGKSKIAMAAMAVAAVGTGFAIGKFFDDLFGTGKETRAIEQAERFGAQWTAVLNKISVMRGGQHSANQQQLQDIDREIAQIQKLQEVPGIFGIKALGGSDGLKADEVAALVEKYKELRALKSEKFADDEMDKKIKEWDDQFTELSHKLQRLMNPDVANFRELDEAYEEHFRKVDELREKGFISAEEWGARTSMVEEARLLDQERLQQEVDDRTTTTRSQALENALKTSEDLYNNSFLRIKEAALNFSTAAAVNISDGLGNAVANIATGAMKAKQAFAEFGKSMLAMLVKTAAQWVVNAVLATALQSAALAASAVIASGVALAWAAPAALVSLASYGANAIPAAAALIGTTALAKTLAVSGVAHGGLDSVPAEGTFLLSQGERVVQPKANEALTEFLDGGQRGGGGGATQVNVFLDGRVLFKSIGEASRDGRLDISSKAIT